MRGKRGNGQPQRLLLLVALLLPLLSASGASGEGVACNGLIAFISHLNRDPSDVYALEIWVINPDGSGLNSLTSDHAADSYPAWSPDGRQFAYSSSGDDGGSEEIYVMEADGSNPTRLTFNEGGISWSPAWSPDGTQIAFLTNRDGNFEIYVMNADGSHQTNLTQNEGNDFDFSWSPDGTQIVFHTARFGNSELYVMNSDGTDVRQLTHNGETHIAPRWSPNGDRIAFVSTRDGYINIYILDLDTLSEVQLTHEDGEGASEVAWSPDGTKLVYVAFYNAAHQLFTMNADGSEQTKVSDFQLPGYSPSWQPVHMGHDPGCADAVPGNR